MTETYIFNIIPNDILIEIGLYLPHNTFSKLINSTSKSQSQKKLIKDNTYFKLVYVYKTFQLMILQSMDRFPNKTISRAYIQKNVFYTHDNINKKDLKTKLNMLLKVMKKLGYINEINNGFIITNKGKEFLSTNIE